MKSSQKDLELVSIPLVSAEGVEVEAHRLSFVSEHGEIKYFLAPPNLDTEELRTEYYFAGIHFWRDTKARDAGKADLGLRHCQRSCQSIRRQPFDDSQKRYRALFLTFIIWS